MFRFRADCLQFGALMFCRFLSVNPGKIGVATETNKSDISFHLFVYFTLSVVVVLMTKMKSIRFAKFASCRDVFKTGG